MASESLGSFGVVEDEDDLNLLDEDPIPFTLVGYDRIPDEDGDHVRREFVFHAVPRLPFGAWTAALAQADANGNVGIIPSAQFLQDVLLPEDKEEWVRTVRGSSIHFEASILGDITKALMERYREAGESGLPTRPRSERRGGPRASGTTSGGGSGGRGSASKAAGSRKASASSTA